MSVRDAINRGYNLLAAVFFGLTGLVFGSEIFVEADPVDKVDNTLLMIVGIVAVVWYFMRNNRFQRSMLPVVLSIAALGVQILGVGIEMGDPVALGDDIPGMILFVPALIILLALYRINGQLIASAPGPAPG